MASPRRPERARQKGAVSSGAVASGRKTSKPGASNPGASNPGASKPGASKPGAAKRKPRGAAPSPAARAAAPPAARATASRAAGLLSGESVAGDPVSPGRAHEREFIPICGLPAVQAVFARDPSRVERLFFEPRLAGELEAARRLMAQARKPYREVAADALARIAGTVRHGGVVAVARPRPLPFFDPQHAAQWAREKWAREKRPLLVLDGIGNPHNLGAILRSAVYFGVARAILADRPDQALPSASSHRVAEGALEHLHLCRARLPQAIAALRRGGFRVVGTALDRATPLAEFRGAELRGADCRGADPHGERPVALVLGNEERGVDPAILALCDVVVTIPGITIPGTTNPGRMHPGTGVSGGGGVQSLNVAAAAAILLYVLTA